ncbi:hypothetical protein D5278_15825 [bacterium 1XD21-13]|nr:hypothetical protein [bacterium 1XD21-13]
MTETKQLNKQMPEEENAYKPLKELNLLDDFLFDVTTMDLEACKIIIELSLGMNLKSIRWKERQKVVHNLPPCYMVIICGFDLYHKGKYRYTFEHCCKEVPGLPLGDECQKIILNTKGRNDDEVDRTLVEIVDFLGKDPAEVQEICRIAETFAPEYDIEKIYKELKSTQIAEKL